MRDKLIIMTVTMLVMFMIIGSVSAIAMLPNEWASITDDNTFEDEETPEAPAAPENTAPETEKNTSAAIKSNETATTQNQYFATESVNNAETNNTSAVAENSKTAPGDETTNTTSTEMPATAMIMAMICGGMVALWRI